MADSAVEAFKETMNIDLSSNPSGVYFVTINLGDQIITRKVMVNRN
jgi:hypothetical protein